MENYAHFPLYQAGPAPNNAKAVHTTGLKSLRENVPKEALTSATGRRRDRKNPSTGNSKAMCGDGGGGDRVCEHKCSVLMNQTCPGLLKIYLRSNRVQI